MPDAAPTTVIDAGAAPAVPAVVGNGAPAATPAAAASTTPPAVSTPPAAPAVPATPPAAAAVPAAPAPLALPKGAVIAAAHVEEVAAFAKANNLAPAAAQAILDGRNAAVVTHQQAEEAQYQALVKSWQAEQAADKEFGGEHHAANMALVNKALTSFASEKLIKELTDSGLIHQTEFVRLLYRVGKASSEDTLNGRGAAGAQKISDEEASLRARYPSMYAASAAS